MELFSAEWAEKWKNSINTDSEYRDVASDWVWPVTFNALTEDNQIDQSIYLDLKNGHCKSLKINEESNQLNAAFIFNASTDHWNRLIQEQKDPIYAIMSGFIKLKKGNILSLSRYSKAGKRLLELCPVLEETVDLDSPQPEKASLSPIQQNHHSFKTTTSGIDFESYPMRLFQKAKIFGIWNPSDISFEKDKKHYEGLSDKEKEIIKHLTSLFVAGEESVTSDILPLMHAVSNDGMLEDEIYLTSFLWEEAKHTEFFSRFLSTLSIPAKELDNYHGDNYRKIFYEELPKAMNSLFSDASQANQVRASVTYNMIVEGTLAETGYHAYYQMLDSAGILPGLKEGIGHLKRDESRHIAYGLYLIARHIEKDPSLFAVAEKRMEELIEYAIGFINEIFDHYNDDVPFGIKRSDFVEFAMNQFSKRLAKLERIAKGELDTSDIE